MKLFHSHFLSCWASDRRFYSSNNNENSLKKSELYSIIKETNGESDAYAPFFPSMIFAVKKGDYELAKTTCENFHRKTLTRSAKSFPPIYNLYFSLFQTKEQLPHLLSLVDDFRKLNIPLSEITYLSLIRCYCDAGDIDTAWKYVEEMKTTGLENRPRVLSPFFDAYEKTLQFEEQMKTVDYMKQLKLPLRPDHLEAILRTFARLRHHNPHKAAELYPKFNQFLHSVADLFQGIRGDQLSILASIVNNCSAQDIARMGLLISSKEELTGAVISDTNLTTDGSILAYNISFQSESGNSPVWSHEKLPIPRSADPYLPETMRQYERLEFLPEKFIVKSAREKALLSSMVMSSTAVQVVNTDVEDRKGDSLKDDSHSSASVMDTHHDTPLGATPVVATTRENKENPLDVVTRTRQWIWEKNLDARLVSIPASSSRCPHCDGQVNNIPLRDDEKRELRQALYSIVERDNSKSVALLKDFETFLSEQNEFEYIVDGANVAYNNQNYEMGRFSYGQIRLVVEELERIGKRVLVIIPSTYIDTDSMIPNRVKSASKRYLHLKDNEIAFLNRLKEKKMIYVVPKHMNDDIFWMMAAVHENRKQACFVVTNDLMRDHAVASLAQSAFARLRTSSLVYFSIYRDEAVRPMITSFADKTQSKNHKFTKTPSSLSDPKRLSAANLAKHNGEHTDAGEEDGEEGTPNSLKQGIDNPYVTFVDANYIREELAKFAFDKANVRSKGYVDNNNNNNQMQSQKAQKAPPSVVSNGSTNKANVDRVKSQASSASSSSSIATDDSEYDGNSQSTGKQTNFGGELPREFFRTHTAKDVATSPSHTSNDGGNAETAILHTMEGNLESLPPLIAERKETTLRSKPAEDTYKQKLREMQAVDDLNWPGHVTFFKPGNYSRDMQESKDVERWHIPATDAVKWLCVKFKPGG